MTVTATHVGSGELAGVANLTPGLAVAEATGHVLLDGDSAAATVSNMAVAERHRRRGVGRLLLGTCELRAAAQYAPPTTLLALVVFKASRGVACCACQGDGRL